MPFRLRWDRIVPVLACAVAWAVILALALAVHSCMT